MILWQNPDMSERIAAAQTTAANKNIEDRAVEKDWWVTAVLKALFSTSCSNYLLFKAGLPSARDGQSLSDSVKTLTCLLVGNSSSM